MKKIDCLDVNDFILENNIKDDDSFLMRVDKRRAEVGDREMALMSAKLGEKGRGDVIRDAWKMREHTRGSRVEKEITDGDRTRSIKWR